MIEPVDMPIRLPNDADTPGPDGAARGVTVKAIAAAVGLSQPAVSQVLNGTGRIAEKTRQRVFQTAEKMGYRPNAAARAVVTRKTLQVGVLVINNPADPQTYPHTYYSILGMNMALESAGYVLCLVRIGDVESGVEGHSRVFREHVLDGVIVTTHLPDRVVDRVRELVPHCVWADTNEWAPTHCVRRDEYDVGRQCAEAAIKAGYRRVVMLTEELAFGGLTLHYSHTERGRGVAAVCRREKVPVETLRHRQEWTPELVADVTARLTPGTAVITTNAARARIVQEIARQKSLMLGRDFGLACCDMSGDAMLTWPDLSGVPFDRIGLGKQAATMMLSLLDGQPPPASLLLPSAWHEGTTLRSSPHADQRGV